MALIKSVELDSGILLEASYVKVTSVGGGKEGAVIEVKYYADTEKYLAGKEHVKQEYYNFVPSVEEGSENFIKQGYEYLKTLPVFADAIDA